MELYIRHGNPIMDKLDLVGYGQGKYESWLQPTTLKTLGQDLYNILNNPPIISVDWNGKEERENNYVYTVEIK